ncbi:unnamed protein product, partial [Mesorhabditis spiculigera]
KHLGWHDVFSDDFYTEFAILEAVHSLFWNTL